MQEQNQHSLKNGAVINHYRIIRVLGAGGFGITYLAEDVSLGMEVVIKEYFPNEFAIRNGDSTIMSKTASDRDFTKGMQRFKEEAQILAKFNHPSIVKILGYFETNNTAYFVMEYEEGIDLSQYMKQLNKSMSQEEIVTIIMPILEGLKEVHKYNYLHRDIKPGNILLRKNHSPVLIDFGASKLAIGEASKSITSMLTEGYAPLEQYSTDIKQQGPFTDLYAVGAVIYKMITGDVPPSAQTRSYQLLQDGHDPYKALSSMKLNGYNKNFIVAVDRALAIKARERQQSIQDFQKDIVGELKHKKNISSKKVEIKKEKSSIASIAVSVLLIMALAGMYVLYQQKNTDTVQSPVKPVVMKTEPREVEQKKKLEAEKLEKQKAAEQLALDVELKKLVKDRKINIEKLQRKTADLIIEDNRKKELEETLISNTMAIEFSIKSMKKNYEMIRKLTSSSVPTYGLSKKGMFGNCKMMTNLSLPQIKEMETMQYCKCIYTNITTGDKDKPKIDCAEPIRVLLDLPKVSEYRKKKTEEIKHQYNIINSRAEEQLNKSLKIMEDSIKNIR